MISSSVRHPCLPDEFIQHGIGRSLPAICSPSSTYYSILCPLSGITWQSRCRQSPTLRRVRNTYPCMAFTPWSCFPTGILLVWSNFREPNFLFYVFPTSFSVVLLLSTSSHYSAQTVKVSMQSCRHLKEVQTNIRHTAYNVRYNSWFFLRDTLRVSGHLSTLTRTSLRERPLGVRLVYHLP